MASLPPTVPTSFVPRASSGTMKRLRSDYTGAFGFLAYSLLIFAIVVAVGVFLYGRVLAAQASSDQATLAKDAAAIDPSTIQSFILLRDQLTQGKMLLDNHVALSGFFNALAEELPSSVQITGLDISTPDSGTITLQGEGAAASFNALAAASDAFAAGGAIDDAIFSGITVNKDGTVDFQFSATIDPSVTAFSPGQSAPSTP